MVQRCQAGYYGNVLDNVIIRASDIVLSIPGILLAISIAAMLGQGLFNLMIAIGVSEIPRYARVVRAQILSVKDQEFVEAAHAVGTSDLPIPTLILVMYLGNMVEYAETDELFVTCLFYQCSKMLY